MKLIYEVAPTIAIVLNLFLIFLVLRRHSRSPIHHVFAFFLFNMALWGITIYGMRMSPTVEQAESWEKAVLIALGLVSVSFYHFVLVFTKGKIGSWRLPLANIKVGSVRLPLAYLTIFIFIALLPTRLLINRMELMWFGPGFQPGPLMYLYLVIYYGLVILSLVLLFRAYRMTESALERKGCLYIAAGVLVCVVGVFSDLLVTKGVHIYPMGIASNIIFAILCTYAILKFQLLNVTFIVRKGTAYVLAYALSTIIYVWLVIIAYMLVTRTWSLADWLSIVFLLALTIGLQPLVRRIQVIVDRWFYKGRYDFLHSLESLGREPKDITEFVVIANRLIDTVMAAMKCRSISVLLPDDEDNYFIPAASRGVVNFSSFRLNRQSVLAWWLNKTGEPITRQKLDLLPVFRALSGTEKAKLESLSAELFVPLTTREGLKGVLILGPGLSEQEYSSEDIRLLKVAAHQVATAIDNARLYDIQTKRYLEQALLARLAQIVASEFDLKQMFTLAFEEVSKAGIFDYSSVMLTDEKEKVPHTAFNWTRGASHDESWKNTDDASTKFESTLRLPLQSENKALGELVFASNESDIYNETNLKLLRQVTVQLAIGVEKAQLYQSEREARDELQKQYRERIDFISALAHEIKTPVTAIITSAELLSDEMITKSPALSELADNLNISAHNLDRRITELMDFVKLQLPDLKLNIQPVDLRVLCESVAEQLKGMFLGKHQTLNLNLSSLVTLVKVDQERITQVLMNLFNNASKFSGNGAQIDVNLFNSDTSAVFEIRDSAPPIKQQEVAHLFNRYYRGSQQSAGGFGLGLYICKRLIELHGGRIWVEIDSSGNRFKFTLPLAEVMEVKHESLAH